MPEPTPTPMEPVPPPQTPLNVIFIIVMTEAAMAIIGFIALAIYMFSGAHADPVILTAFVGMEGGLIGSLGTILSNTRQSQVVNGNGKKENGVVRT